MPDQIFPGAGRPLWEGHRQRLRRQMEREGWDSLRPYEMVELVLYHAVPRQDLSDVARLLMHRFGSVGGVFAAPRERLLEVPGVTPGMADWIGLTGELMKAYYDLHAERDIRLGCYQELLAFLEPRLTRLGEGELWALYADFDFNLITYAAFRADGEWWSAANARGILTQAIGNGARYVYLALRAADPAAFATPENSARLESIAVTLRAANMDLVDCALVAPDEVYSMNLHGHMQAVRAGSGCVALHERYGEPGSRTLE